MIRFLHLTSEYVEELQKVGRKERTPASDCKPSRVAPSEIHALFRNCEVLVFLFIFLI